MRQPGACVLQPLKEKRKTFPFCVMVRESENIVEHLRARGAQRGRCLGSISSFDINRVPSGVGSISHMNGEL